MTTAARSYALAALDRAREALLAGEDARAAAELREALGWLPAPRRSTACGSHARSLAEEDAAALASECPTCASAAGEPCRALGMPVRWLHATRLAEGMA